MITKNLKVRFFAYITIVSNQAIQVGIHFRYLKNWVFLLSERTHNLWIVRGGLYHCATNARWACRSVLKTSIKYVTKGSKYQVFAEVLSLFVCLLHFSGTPFTSKAIPSMNSGFIIFDFSVFHLLRKRNAVRVSLLNWGTRTHDSWMGCRSLIRCATVHPAL